jgi:hypothetical protein
MYQLRYAGFGEEVSISSLVEVKVFGGAQMVPSTYLYTLPPLRWGTI